MKLLFALILTLVLLFVNQVENATPSSSALAECAKVHHFDPDTVPNANGSSFSNFNCRLNCMIGNTLLATDSIYEGVACPLDSTGVSHHLLRISQLTCFLCVSPGVSCWSVRRRPRGCTGTVWSETQFRLSQCEESQWDWLYWVWLCTEVCAWWTGTITHCPARGFALSR